MPKVTLRSPNLTGGVSTQPPQVRFPNQLEEALNASFSVYDGASKRPGTEFLAAPSDMDNAGTYRMAPIVRDAVDQFLVVFGSSPSVRVFRASNGAEMAVSITPEAEDYLTRNGTLASDLRAITITDHSFILNRTVPVKGKTSPVFTPLADYADYDALVAAIGSLADGSYYRTTGDTPAQPRGFWKFTNPGAVLTRHPPPDQPNAMVDESTMPVKLIHNQDDTFTCDVVTWGFRWTGDNLTNPLPSVFERELPLSDLSYHRDRLVLSGDEFLVFSQAGDLYSFYVNDDKNIVDSDPLDLQISGEQGSKIRHVIPFGKRLVLDTEAHRQFELTDSDTLTFETAAITPTTRMETLGARPMAVGLSLYFGAMASDARQMMEYVYDDIRAGSDAQDVSEHVRGLIPSNVRAILGSSNARTVLVVEGDGPRILAHSWYWNGNQKQQSAWGVWEIAGNARIQDAVAIGTTAYLLVSRGGATTLERMPMIGFTEIGELPIHADRQVRMIGTYLGGRTSWTAPTDDEAWDVAILGNEWGVQAGKEIPLVAMGSTLEAVGNYSGKPVTLAKRYPFRLEISRPYRKDMNGQPILGEKLTAMRWVVQCRRTGEVSLVARDTSRTKPVRTVKFAATAPMDQRLQAWFGGDVDRMRLRIESDGARPLTVTGWELEAQQGRR